MAPKRSIIRVPIQAPAKKAKVMDPVTKNISIVCNALSDESFEVPCRGMLKTVAPMVLRLPNLTRHAYETKTALMIEEVLKARVDNFASRLDETTKEFDQAQSAKDAIDSELVDIQRRLETKAADVSSRRDVWKADSAAKDEADRALKATQDSFTSFEKETQLKVQDVKDCGMATEMLKLDLTMLPASNRNANLLKVSQQLEAAHVDQSLLSAIPLALQKKPEERGTFDLMAIEQAEQLLQKHSAVLEERLQGRDDLKAEKEATVDFARTTMNSAVDKCQESEKQLRIAEQDEKQLQVEQKAKEKAAFAKEKELNKILKQKSLDKQELEKVNDILSAFNFLLERDDASHPMEETDV